MKAHQPKDSAPMRRPLLAALALLPLAACQYTLPSTIAEQDATAVPVDQIPPPANLTDLTLPEADTLPQTPLVGTRWKLTSFRNSQNQTFTPTAAQTYTLQLSGNGRVAMQLACNRGMGGWTSPDSGGSRGTVNFSQMASSMAACPPSPFSQIAADLSASAQFSINSGKLYLLPMNNGGIYTFTAQ